MASVLINSGADVRAKSRDGGSALQCAVSNCHLDTVALLINRGADVASCNIAPACAAGDEAMVRMLLQGGADATQTSPDGRTPLHAASTSAICRLLLDRKAGVGRADRHGRTPLHGGEDGLLPPAGVALLLLDSGAAPMACDQARLFSAPLFPFAYYCSPH